jgi:hypothetical protein
MIGRINKGDGKNSKGENAERNKGMKENLFSYCPLRLM